MSLLLAPQMIKVAIFDDNQQYRNALEALINVHQEIKLIHAASNLNSLDKKMKDLAPDVCIMDIQIPGKNGIEGTRIIKQVSPETNVLILTVFEDDDYIFESVKAGAVGYLLKKDPPEMIIEAIKKIATGETIMNGKIARKVLDFFSRQNGKPNLVEEYGLTRREKEILELLMTGMTYKEIALKSFISLDTMYTHTRNIFTKLNVHSRAEIAAKLR